MSRKLDMTLNIVRSVVSRQKKRFQEDGFDLDLSYINDQIIAMGYPATNVEFFYRNPLEEVVRFLNLKHKEKFRVFNLCSEKKRQYCSSKFDGFVIEKYRFKDHHPPPFRMIESFCETVYKWLNDDPNNVVAIHCKAGKGRTGTMISCYLLFEKYMDLINKSSELSNEEEINPAQAIEIYDDARTSNKKGVTIPSQRRYVIYFSDYLRKCFRSTLLNGINKVRYENVPYTIQAIRFNSVPKTQGGGTHATIVIIKQLREQNNDSNDVLNRIAQFDFSNNIKKTDCSVLMKLEMNIPLQGDILIEILQKNPIKNTKFHFWFNTFFVSDKLRNINEKFNLTTEDDQNGSTTPRQTFADHNKHKCYACTEGVNGEECNIVEIPVSEIDRAHKNKQNFPNNFKLRLYLKRANSDTLQSSYQFRGNCDSEASAPSADEESDDEG